MMETQTRNDRESRMEAKIKKRVALEEKAFRLVEKLLDNPITEEFLLEAGKHIDRSHYADVVEERSIAGQCGYPLCSKPLGKVSSQKYHISLKSKKVYDITERKKFCSERCFAASEYFAAQISNTAVLMREDAWYSDTTLCLLPPESTESRPGEVVLIASKKEMQEEIQSLEENPPNHPSHRNEDSNAAVPSSVENVADKVSQVTLQGQGQGQGEARGQGQRSDIEGQDNLCSDSSLPVQTEETGTQTKSPEPENVSAMVTKKLEARLAKRKQMYDLPEKPQAEVQGLKGKQEAIDVSAKKHTMISTKDDGKSQDMPSEASGVVKGSKDGQLSKGTTVVSSPNKGEVLLELLEKREKLQAQLEAGNKEAKHVEQVAKEAPTSEKTGCFKVKQKGKFHQFLEDVSLPASSESSKKSSGDTCCSSDAFREMEQGTEQHRKDTDCKRKADSHLDSKTPKLPPLELIRSVLLEWCTGDSIRFLTKQNHQRDGEGKTEEDFSKKYAALEQRVEKQIQQGELDFLGEGKVGAEENVATQGVPDMEKLRKEAKAFELRVQEFYQGKDTNVPAGGSKGKESKSKKSERKPVVPYVDSRSQLALRRKIVLDKLNNALPTLLSPLKLNVQDISSHIRHLVYTFNLSSQNIVLKPAEWTLAAFFLLKLLRPQIPELDEALKEDYAVHYLRTLTLSIGITDTQVQDVLDAVTHLP